MNLAVLLITDMFMHLEYASRVFACLIRLILCIVGKNYCIYMHFLFFLVISEMGQGHKNETNKSREQLL